VLLQALEHAAAARADVMTEGGHIALTGLAHRLGVHPRRLTATLGRLQLVLAGG
jgi:hypothetical protein